MDILLEIAVSGACKVAGWLVAPVNRHCGYVIRSDHYVRELNDEVQKLEDQRVGVQRCVEIAENNNEEIKREVVRWKNNAETVTKTARGVLVNHGKTKQICFYGWLPNPKARYCIGRDARNTAEDIQKLIQQGQFESVCYERAAPGLVNGAPRENPSAGNGGHTIIDSRASIFQGIMKALDDEKLKVIGVYGPGGVGKTTLLDEVEKKLRKQGRPFHMIATSKVSQNPDLKKIQDDIASALGLNLKDKTSDEERRRLLFQRLENDPTKKVLILLDDLWKQLDLREVGIPSGDESRGCQVLLTSRYKDVLQKTSASPIFHLEGLKDDEALMLFEKKVGDRLQKDKELKAIAPKVVKKLAGLPLLINSVASVLKDSEASTWRIYSKKIKKLDIETIVKMSYDHLEEEEAKSLFLLCGLIGGTINVELLWGLGMGLGLFEGFDETVEVSRDRLNDLLDSLRSACLLLDGGDDKKNVTIHDLYSEVAVSTPFRGQNSFRMNSNDDSWPKGKLEKCWAICLANVVGDRLVELMRSGCPALKILMLSHSEDRDGRPTHRHDVGDCCRLDFTCKEELRVLYLRSMHIPTLPPSIEILENLHSLYLDKCDVDDVTILGEIKALQILSFAGSSISSLPKEIEKLTKLKLLNLSHCNKLVEIKPGVLKSLINLEELYMRRSFDKWMGEDEISSETCNAKLAELKSLRKLTALEISIHDPNVLLKNGDLPFENLIKFWICIGRIHWREFKGLTTMMLTLEGCDGILSIEWVQKILQKTQYLHLDGLRQFNKKSAHELCIRGFPKLKHLYIQNCFSIKHIVSSSNGAFPLLESLFLENLTNLEKISDGSECFSKLKVMSVTKCNRLEYIWCLSHMQRLAQLEEIEVESCDSMRAIVIDDARKDIVLADNKVELPNVRRLTLDSLPKMTSFCIEAEITLHGAPIQIMDCAEKKSISYPHGKKEAVTATSESQYAYSDSFFNRKVNLPSLEELSFHSLGSLKRIWPHEIPESSLDNLAKLCVFGCSNLLNVFLPTIIGRLHNLRSVRIKDCRSLETVFECGSRDSNTEQTRVLLPVFRYISIQRCRSLESVFDCGSLTEHKIISVPKLRQVDVKSAKALRHLVKSNSQTFLGFPSLEEVWVDDCRALRYLFPYGTATTLEKLERLIISHCEQMKEVVAIEEGGQSEAGVLSFPFLESLTISMCLNFEAFILNPTSVERPLGEMAKENDESRQPFFNEMVTFPTLSRIHMANLKVKELWSNQIQDDSFCELRSLELVRCDNLQRIAPSHVWKRLQHCLKILKVKFCCSIEIIYESDATVAQTGQLRRLVLHDLDNLRYIWRYDSLPNVKVPFPNLADVDVRRCPRMRVLFETFTASSLGQIKWLQVESCDDMELIADHGECEGATCTTITFFELDALKLKELPKFRGYLPEKYHVEFPSPRALIRVGCGKEPDQSDGSDVAGWDTYRWGERVRLGWAL